VTRRTPSPASRPSNRDDSTRPRRARPANGIPYPGAPDPAGAGTRPHRSTKTPKPANRAREVAPIPPTVWTAGPEPIDPTATWPVPIIEAITTSFSAVGDRVVLALWPTAGAAGAERAADDELTAAHQAVRALRRDAAVRQFVPAPSSSESVTADVEDRAARDVERSNLVITSLRPEFGADGAIETFTLAAARALTFGGVFAVYTSSDWSTGRLTDPSESLIAAAQNADLLYLQHIVTLHVPIKNGRLQPPSESDGKHGGQGARNPGSRAVHARVHGDVLVFAQARADVEHSEDLR
jgi:hypothetical protein